jgi:hypothetical protein
MLGEDLLGEVDLFVDLGGSQLRGVRIFEPVADSVGDGVGLAFVGFVDAVVDCLLPLVFRWQIEVDVRPSSPAFTEESSKQEFHAHRINRSDFQCVAPPAKVREATSPGSAIQRRNPWRDRVTSTKGLEAGGMKSVASGLSAQAGSAPPWQRW